ncbi:MAG TPA: hypothetical protein VKT73_14925 [Xanthobacteraceae bacterium]|nr:hypothetical protein [Xanthobacteraceae bacterium]
MPRIVFATLFLLATALAAAAQSATATARLGPGQTATVTAVRATGEPARLEIALPKGTQRFDGIGEQFLTLKSGGKDSIIVIADLNGDGIDEIVVRGSVTSDASAVIVYQWDGDRGEYLPVDFTSDDQGEGKPFLFVEAAGSITVDRSGVIEVTTPRTDQSGRTSSVIERYRWDGNGFKYAADN